MKKLVPFTKWTGGKRQLLPELEKRLPKKYNTYYEPFVGGGALFFHLQPKKAVINDLNNELILTYLEIKNNVEDLLYILNIHKEKNNKEYYLSIRNLDRSESILKLTNTERAARILYMLRVNFNGLYRVNSKNQFNVPYGKYKNPKIVDVELLFNISEYLNSCDIKILNLDFSDVLNLAEEGDFVYLDPPYIPISNTSSFTSYTNEKFLLEDQIKLRDKFIELDKKKVFVMLSNSDTPLTRELYKNFKIEEVRASRAINSNPKGRGKISELIIRNY